MGCINLKKNNEIVQSKIPPNKNISDKINQEQIIIKDERRGSDVPKVLIINTNNNNNLGLNNENIISNNLNLPKNFSNLGRKSDNINNKDYQNINNNNKNQNPTTNIENKKKNKIFKAEISDVDKLNIRQSLQNHFLFKGKSPQIINNLIDKLEMMKLNAGTILFNKGDKGNYFYIIKEGKLELITEYGNKLLKADETFGELALIENKKRTATVKCVEKCTLFLLNGKLFREVVTKLNEGELKERLNFLKAVSIFNVLDNNNLNAIAVGMLKCEFDVGQTIVYEGDVGQSIYIIKSGSVKCFKGETQVRILGSKDFFGESAVLFNTNRSLSVLVVEKTICFQVSESFLIDCLGNDYKNVIISSITKEALKNSKYMKIFTNPIYFSKIFECCDVKIFNDNQVVIQHNEKNKNKFYVLLSGNFLESNTYQIVSSRGNLYGDFLLKENKNINYDIISQGECRVLEFDWDSIVPKLNIKIEKKKILSLFNRIDELKKINLFNDTSENKLIDICTMMKKEKFSKGETIFSEGEMGNKLYLIKKGKVKAFKNKKFIRELCEGNCFGEVALLINEPRTATVIAETDVSCFSLTKDDFNSFIDKNMLNYLAKKTALQDNFNLTLNDLYFCKTLGKGKFGSVSLVHNNKYHFAIKLVNKKAADKQKILIKYFIQERNILLTLEHPFIMKLVKTFKDENFIYFLCEYIQGRTFSKYLNTRTSKQLRNTEETRFYIATLFLILDYLNNMEVCHRDLKPDNIIVGEQGYLKLIDFGTSIKLKDFTTTITGTPHYIAPEVLLGKGYGFSCDFWSIGIITHEIYFGIYPFGRNAKDPIDVYKEIVKKELVIKNGDPKIINLITNLLNKKVTERICSLEKAKKLAIFQDFNWNELIDLSMKPSYIPKITPLKSFKENNIKYLNIVKQELAKKANEGDDDSLLSSYESDEDKDIEYDPNWADIF